MGINLYFHAGSSNHGCEAIVRATHKILNMNETLFSQDVESDIKYQIDQIVKVEPEKQITNLSRMEKIIVSITSKFIKTDYFYYKYAMKNFFDNVKKGDIFLSIGGDNYCYAGKEILGFYNKIIHKKGGKTVLWGCSFDPKDMTKSIAKDISLYDAIVARETISYEELKKYNTNTFLFPDPAFQLDKIKSELPNNFLENNTVGINLSPLIIKSENKRDITKRNYECLIEYILKDTDMNIALIPHVVEQGNDDRVPLGYLYEKYRNSGRICIINDCNSMELKGIISKCRFFVGARTHATIAAYSTCVPTMVVGYSVKARGIAKDLFKEDEKYVIPVQSLKDKADLKNNFEWFLEREEFIKNHLVKTIPNYIEKAEMAREVIRGLIND